MVGGAITTVGIVISGIAAYHLVAGTPLMQGGSKLSPGEHVASNGELWFGALGGLPFLVLGLLMILSGLNCAVTIDDEGISATNLLKRPFFKAAWSEVASLERIDASPGSGYKVVANGKTLRIQTSLTHMKVLIAEIERRIG